MSKNQSKIRNVVSKVPADVKVANVGNSRSSRERVFVLTDNCAAIGAADVPPYFTGKAQSCNYGVKGVDAQTEAMQIGELQSGAMVLTDDAGEEFIGRYGGGLKATPGMLNEITWSVSQMQMTFDRTGGKADGNPLPPTTMHVLMTASEDPFPK
jgi:hypothetical protein